MTKPHLVKVPEPIPEFRDYFGACGEKVKKAKFEFRLDPQDVNLESLSAIGNCKHCIEALARETWEGTSYVYGILPAEESEMELSA
jgi:hypothetical protein